MTYSGKHLLQGLAVAGLAVTLCCGLLFFIDPGLYARLVREDGLVEWLTAASLLFTAAVVAGNAVRARAGKRWPWKLFQCLLVAGLFFGFGEEISWGQRLLGAESGEFFRNNNLQGETNLHNLEIGGIALNRVVFTWGLGAVFGLYFLASTAIYRQSVRLRKIMETWGVPLPRPAHTWTFLALTLAIMTIPDNKKWELWEAAFALCLLLIALHPYRPLKSRSVH